MKETPFFNVKIDQKTTIVTVAVQHCHLARPQFQANTEWNESLHNSLRKRVSLALPCWKLARTISYRPFCIASAICCMLSIYLLWKMKRKISFQNLHLCVTGQSLQKIIRLLHAMSMKKVNTWSTWKSEMLSFLQYLRL